MKNQTLVYTCCNSYSRDYTLIPILHPSYSDLNVSYILTTYTSRICLRLCYYEDKAGMKVGKKNPIQVPSWCENFLKDLIPVPPSVFKS